MPVVRNFNSNIAIADLVPILDSVAAHVAAKLEQFATDERTLTDDLCDMFYIWCQRVERRVRRRVSLPSMPFGASITKTTQQEEATVGADLAITVGCPDGTTRALIQAKVFDPTDHELRCATPTGWDKLWAQLVLMQKRNGPLSFLLIYVPAGVLEDDRSGYSTWERNFAHFGTAGRESRFGALLIPVSALLDRNGNWRHNPPVRHDQLGWFKPEGISLSRLFIDLLICNRGEWRPYAADEATFNAEYSDHFPINYRAYREIGIFFTEAPPEEWSKAVEGMRQWTDRQIE